MPADEELMCSEAEKLSDVKRLNQEIRSKAIALLARREHACQELALKLSRIYSDEAAIAEQLQCLVHEGLLSDLRFTEVMIRSGLSKSHGLGRIKSTLRAKGVSGEIIEQAFIEVEIDWLAQLRELSLRKYGDAPCEDNKETARRIRFFQYRGYSMPDIYRVLDGC